MTRLRLASLMATLFFFAFATIVLPASPQEVSVSAEQVEYTLPYHGILPDHPLFFLKNTRDNLWLFLSRDNIKKAELLLLFSDKRAGMAISLSKKGKWEEAGIALTGSESKFSSAIDAIDNARKQGAPPGSDFIQTLKLSNAKHRQIIESLLKDSPAGNRTEVESALKTNISLKDRLSRF